MRVYASISLVILGAIVNTVPRFPSLYVFDGDQFCLWQAASFVILAIAAMIKKDTQVENAVWVSVSVVAFGNFYDEKWGRAIAPTVDQLIIEYAIGISAAAWTIYSIVKWIRQKQQ